MESLKSRVFGSSNIQSTQQVSCRYKEVQSIKVGTGIGRLTAESDHKFETQISGIKFYDIFHSRRMEKAFVDKSAVREIEEELYVYLVTSSVSGA